MPDDKRDRLKRWLESGEAKLHPATFPQRELWEASPVPPTDVSNNICTVTKVRGPVSREFCETALAMVVEKQEVLRLSILPGKNGPVQLVRKSRKPAVRFSLVEQDLLDDGAIDDRIEALIREPFDLVAGPLYRVEIIRRSELEHVLVLVIHHAIADGWTLGVFMSDLWTAYALQLLGLPGALDPVGQSYSEWGAAERAFWQSREIQKRRPFWVEQLHGAERLFGGKSIPGGDLGKRLRWVGEIPGKTIGDLRGLAARKGVTFFSAALTAFQMVMAKATGKEDILVGSPTANRGKKVSWDTMGSFAGIVPLRSRLDMGRTLTEQLGATHQMTVESFAHALPFVELLKCLGVEVVPGQNPVFDVRFALQNHPVPDVSMPGMEVEYRTRSTGTCRFDLACELTEIGSTLEVVWLFREDLFSATVVEAFHRQFFATLKELCGDGDPQVSEVIRHML